MSAASNWALDISEDIGSGNVLGDIPHARKTEFMIAVKGHVLVALLIDITIAMIALTLELVIIIVEVEFVVVVIF